MERGIRRMWELVGELGPQLRQSYASVDALEIPGAQDVRRVVVFGMGGSAAAAELAAGCFSEGVREILVVREYGPRHSLRTGDLVLFSSYSGGTEEVLSAYDAVLRSGFRGPRVVFSSGGDLSGRAREDGIDVASIPGGLPPRASLGHGIGLFCGLLGALGWIEAPAEVSAALERLDAGRAGLGLHGQPGDCERGRGLADALAGRWPVLYSGSPLTRAVSRRWRAQWNENAKMLVAEAELPELDHNEIVGWEAATPAREQASVVALRDDEEHPRVARRFAITREVLRERVGNWHEVRAAEGRRLARAMELVQFGDAVSVLLAERHGVDPMPVGPIDELKARLSGS